MAQVLAPMDAGVSAQLSHVYQNHRAKLQEFVVEFRRTKANVHTAREHAELLSSVRRDISSRRAGGGNTATDNLLRERAALHQADRMADQILGQASATQERLVAQRLQMQNANSRMSSVNDMFGGIFQNITQIRRKKSRDWWITVGCIALCVFFLLWWMFGGSSTASSSAG